MRIAFITSEYVTDKKFDGGLANYIYKITHLLPSANITPIIILASDKNYFFTHEGIDVHGVNVHPRFMFFLKIVNMLFFYQFDLLHPWFFQSYLIHKHLKKNGSNLKIDVFQYASYKSLSLKPINDAPVIVRISAFQALWDIAYGKSPKSRATKQVERIEIKAFSKADYIFGPSQLIATLVESKVHKKVSVVRSPPQAPHPPSNTLHSPKLEIKSYLLFFGSMGRLKGVDLIADILPSIFKRHPQLHFFFAGKDMKFNNKKMSDYVLDKCNGYHERIHFLGSVKHDTLRKLIANALAVVLPSRIDNYPNACIEAMAESAIVIGSRGASFEEIITDGVDGVLFENESLESLECTIERILFMPNQQLDLIKKNARISALTKISSDSALAQHIQFYTKIFEESR